MEERNSDELKKNKTVLENNRDELRQIYKKLQSAEQEESEQDRQVMSDLMEMASTLTPDDKLLGNILNDVISGITAIGSKRDEFMEGVLSKIKTVDRQIEDIETKTGFYDIDERK